MRVNLCPSNISRYSFKKIFRHINAISLHFSPVTILQRFIRGHLTRKRLREKGVKVKVVQCQRKGRNLLSPKWKLPFGKVEIDYQKLKLLKSQDGIHKCFRVIHEFSTSHACNLDFCNYSKYLVHDSFISSLLCITS